MVGLALYAAFWVWLARNTTDLLFIVLVALPLIPVFYFVIGVFIGLGIRAFSR